MTFATALTLLRLFLIIPIAFLVHQSSGVAALVLFTMAAATDYFDGFVARRFDQITPLGARLDASVDKLLVYVLIGALLFQGTYLSVIVAAAFTRDSIVELLRHQAAAKGRVIPANRWGKAKFLLQCLSIGIALIGLSLPKALMWTVMANITLAVAVVASIPGVIVVWNVSRKETTAPFLHMQKSPGLDLGDQATLSSRARTHPAVR